MNRLDADDLALAMEIQQKHAAGISAEKEETQLAKKVSIADRIGDEMDGQRLDVETVMIEMTALIVAITVGIHSPQARDQAMLVTGLILQRLRENDQHPTLRPTENIH
ncbi:hypothetical protein [Endozoicomonas sp. SCSIO W0465]|uniref:hypothetical protein n=1 Tax=Endozoicomonas sp. SCSIO W0465 TaxID=2918516 RepID=UPI002074EC6A|nr:hypothetical protein [Endozoicomonas sp. SCSIO W0465]USE36415.1 hypothetical protein MJO57_31080 [Endozoicomonas sp. SCSIO W0465]